MPQENVPSSQFHLRVALAIAALALLLTGIYFVLRQFFTPLGWAAVLAVSLSPLFASLSTLLGKRERLAAIIITLLTALLLIALFVPLTIAAVRELQTFIEDARPWLEEFQNNKVAALSRLPLAGSWLAANAGAISAQGREIIQFLSGFSSNLISALSSAAALAFSFTFKLLICLMALYSFLVNGRLIRRRIDETAVKLGGPGLVRIQKTVKLTIKAAGYGVLFTSLAQGFLAALGFYLFSAPLPVLFGFVCMIFSLIPFGTPLVYGPLCLYMAIHDGRMGAALGLLIFCALTVSTADNVIRPLFMSQQTRTPLVVVLLGVIGGISAFGVLGVFLGPAVLAMARALWDDWLEAEEEPAG